MHLLRLLKLFFLLPLSFGIVEDNGGGAIDTPTVAEPVVAETPAADPVPGTAEPAPGGTPAAAAPVSMREGMLSAIRKVSQEAEDPGQAGQPRDASGRFLPKPGDLPAVDPAKAVASPADTPKPAVVPGQQPGAAKKGDEDLQMPPGLKEDGQRRFQALANEVKELRPLREQNAMLTTQVAYVGQTFKEHGIQREQFEQAASVIGMINKGDFRGARQVLMGQLQQIAVMSGEPLQMVDPLEAFPDLRQQVDSLQMTEAAAMQVARSRTVEAQVGKQRQAAQTQVEQQRNEAQVQSQALNGLDAFEKQMKSTDLDFDAIYKILEPQLAEILRDTPPQQWVASVTRAYNLIKRTAGASLRQPNPVPSANALRATGAASPMQAPQTMRQAMFPGR